MTTTPTATVERLDTHTSPLDRHLIALERAYRCRAYGMMGAEEFSREALKHLGPVILATIRLRDAAVARGDAA